MGRSVIAENLIQAHVENFFGSEKWYIGLIIGQQTAQKDFALHLIRTPKPDPGDIAADDNGDDLAPSRGTETRKPDSLSKIDEHYVATHAKQVQRMLPGGLDVMGIFAFAPPDMMKDAQVKLRQVLYAVHKSLSKGPSSMIPRNDDEVTERIVLQICSLTKKVTCRSFDAADPKCAARPADWKYQSFAGSWLCLNTTVSLDIVIPVTLNDMGLSLMKQIQKGVNPVCDNIWNSLSIVNGQLSLEDDLLDSSQQGKKKKGRTGDSGCTTFEVELFTQSKFQNPIPDPDVAECGAKMQLRGRMSCCAYVHNKASTQEGLQALKTDVIRSLLSRCELMYEEIRQTEEDQDPKVLYETPRRVFGQLLGTDIFLCDYMFPDETVAECIERIKELADLELDEDSLQTEKENLPNDDDLVKPAQSLEEEENLDVQDPKEKTNYSNFYSVLFGGIVAAIAAVSYMLIGQDP